MLSNLTSAFLRYSPISTRKCILADIVSVLNTLNDPVQASNNLGSNLAGLQKWSLRLGHSWQLPLLSCSGSGTPVRCGTSTKSCPSTTCVLARSARLTDQELTARERCSYCFFHKAALLTRFMSHLPTFSQFATAPPGESLFTPHLIEAVLYSADASEVVLLSLLNRAWHTAATSEALWKHLCQRDLPTPALNSDSVLSYRSLYFQSGRKHLSPYGLWAAGDTLVWGR
jgi:hypothetical protein